MTSFSLRAWRPEDAPELAAAANNARVAANLRNAFPHPYTLQDAEQFIGDCLTRGEERQLTRAIVVEGKAVGGIGVFVKEDIYEKTAELGYWLAEEHWGKGIMTAAVRQMCREAFARFDIVRIFAEPFAHNQGSRRVLEKSGFTCEGTMRNGVFKNGEVCSYCIYGLLREEWQQSSLASGDEPC